MSLLGRILTLFPLATLALASTLAYFLASQCPITAVTTFFLTLYLLPPIAFRIHQLFFPIKTGVSLFSDPTYNAWWGSHQIQMLFIAFPALESFLTLIPGVYSIWLRLWGAKVGRKVYWTPRVQIVDRPLIEIGDYVVFGHQSACVSHVIDERPDGSQIIYVKPVKIGSRVFIGAASVIGPGCTVSDGMRLDAQTILKVNEKR
jgi:hypothetical protein